MHKLHRDPVAPTGLANYRSGRDPWGQQSPNFQERQEIWTKLNAMQGHRCAYCEAAIKEGERHIEHFRQRGRYSQGTFAWDNLFGSCNRQGSCGDFKDKCGHYSHSDLIKPDIEDPESFLIFSQHGSVTPRSGLNAANQQRAKETIRILNLNGALRQIRQKEVAGYVQTAEEFAEIASHFPESEWLPLLNAELTAISHLPFATAIKHVLTRQS